MPSADLPLAPSPISTTMEGSSALPAPDAIRWRIAAACCLLLTLSGCRLHLGSCHHGAGSPGNSDEEACADHETGITLFESIHQALQTPPDEEIPWPKYHPVPTKPVYGPVDPLYQQVPSPHAHPSWRDGDFELPTNAPVI